MRPTAPEAASTYQGPVSPRITPDRGGRGAAEVLAKTRISPGTSRRPPACQRAWPLRTSSRSTASTRAAGTPVRVWSRPPSRRASARIGSAACLSAAIWRGVVGAMVPLRSPISSVVTTQAYGGCAGGQFECRPLPLLVRCSLRCGDQGVEEALLLRPAQGGEPVERRERRRGQMRAAGGAATAPAVEHHAAPERGGGDAHGMAARRVLHACRRSCRRRAAPPRRRTAPGCGRG